MNTATVQDIAYYLLSRGSRDHINIGTTKLVKLFYLIDLEFYRWNRHTLTEADWIFYHYGPYCEDLLRVAETADGVQPQPEMELSNGRFYKGYSITKYRQNVGAGWSAPIRGIVDAIYQRWAPVDLTLLLDHVYYETPPMLQAKRFQPLDFSVIPNPKEPVESPRDFSNLIAGEKAEFLRRKLAARQGGFRPTRALKVKLDEATASALQMMGEDD